MIEIITTAVLAGFSVGISCVSTCAPFYAPYLAADEKKMKIHIKEFGMFLLGRLIGYLSFGFIIGYLGEKINIGLIQITSNISLAILSAIIILLSIGLIKNNSSFALFCPKFKTLPPPFFIGLFTGINLCPPFLISLNYIFILGKIWYGIIYFFFFFLATNIYFIPLLLLGKLGAMQEFQKYAKYAMLLVGILFFIYSLANLFIHKPLIHYALFNKT